MIDLLPMRKDGGPVGFVDFSGTWVIEPRFDFAARFSEGRALVRIDGRYGFIDSQGALAVAAEYNSTLR